MNRRHFLTSLAAVAATAVLDPERLLWVPGARVTFDMGGLGDAHLFDLVWLDRYSDTLRTAVVTRRVGDRRWGCPTSIVSVPGPHSEWVKLEPYIKANISDMFHRERQRGFVLSTFAEGIGIG